MTDPFRLLPGDPAPQLKLAHGLNGHDVHPIVFDRLSFVILWNVGCSGCLPAIDKFAELGVQHDVPCFGIAISTRNVQATQMAVDAVDTKAILALEESTTIPSATARGWVTRQWLEASGLVSVPAAFIVDKDNSVLWMGNPNEIERTFVHILNGEWDVSAARQAWKTRIPDTKIRTIRTEREVLDAVFASDIEGAHQLIEKAEKNIPSIVDDREFNIIKLTVLTGDPSMHELATTHYTACADQFSDDIDAQLRFALTVIRRMPNDEVALSKVIARLQQIDKQYAAGDQQPNFPRQYQLHLALAEALKLTNHVHQASRHLDIVTKLVSEEDTADALKKSLQSDIAKVLKGI